MKLISVVTPCFNEEDNVETLYMKVKEQFAALPQYNYEHIFIDNASKDKTVEILRGIAAKDKNVRVIVNARNFGHIRSPYHANLQASGDAIIDMAADLQDPPELIGPLLKKWEKGYKIVLGVKTNSEESKPMFIIRKFYYAFINRLSEIELVKNSTGFGLYDRRVIEILREMDDVYPYFRGLTAEIGFESAKIEYVQPSRKRGITKNNFYTLYDMAMLGITNHSKIPLRMATLLGFGGSALSLCVALIYFVYKIVFWKSFSVGMAPIVIGLFLFSSVQLFFLGIIGEYIGSIHTQVMKRPLVVERERINFDSESNAKESKYKNTLA
jgi:glycosyltransferase involved in cell wall biosynthesis